MRRPCLKLAVAVAALSASAAFAQAACPTRASWPTTEWPQDPVDKAAKAADLKALEDYAFTLEGEDRERKGFRTNSLLIIKHGAIVYERYARGFDETKPHISWSVAKSVSSALVGVAVGQGLLSLDASICETVTEYAGTEKCAITVRDVITFGTGLDWQEEYEDATYQVSSVLAMLFGSGHRDQLRHILDHRLVGEPGKMWRYSTGDAELASLVAKRALAQKHGVDAFWKVLFEPIGMKSAVVEEDLRGTPLGGSMVFATPRDFARFGYLFLNDGCWAGARIVPEGWVPASLEPSAVFLGFASVTEKMPSGYSWWLNVTVPPRTKPWPELPDDVYAAMGHWGQRIIVVPSLDIVIVRTGDDREGSISVNELAKLSLAVAR